jgi:hypothetical protein
VTGNSIDREVVIATSVTQRVSLSHRTRALLPQPCGRRTSTGVYPPRRSRAWLIERAQVQPPAMSKSRLATARFRDFLDVRVGHAAEVVIEQHREALLDVARRLLDVRHE